MIDAENAARIIETLRTSGRLRDTDQAVMARALNLVFERRAEFPDDTVEALVQAVASLVVCDAKKERCAG
jgi:hypothetical protein